MIKPHSLVSKVNSQYDVVVKLLAANLNIPISTIESNSLVITEPHDRELFKDNNKFYISQKDNVPDLLSHWNKSDFGMLIKKSLPLSSQFVTSMIEWSLSKNNDLPKNFFDSVDYSINSSSRKDFTIDLIKNQLEQWDFNSRVCENILYVAEELIMNALFDAPVDKNDNYIFKNVPRNTDIQLPKPIRIQLSYNGSFCLIRVKDTYGSLEIDNLCNHLQKIAKHTVYNAPKNSTGSGVGLAQSIQKGANLIFKINPKVSTEVIAMFPKTDSYRDILNYDQLFIIQQD